MRHEHGHGHAMAGFSHVTWRPAWPPGAPHGGGPAGRDTEILATPALPQPACCPKPLKLQCPLRHQVQIDKSTIAAGRPSAEFMHALRASASQWLDWAL
eukprot:scaffold1889_cov108-Isochrysis_galbana.AAC.3